MFLLFLKNSSLSFFLFINIGSSFLGFCNHSRLERMSAPAKNLFSAFS